MNYPDEEMEDGSSESSDSSQEEDEDEYEGNDEGNSDIDGRLRLSDDCSDDGKALDEHNGNDLAARVSEAGNAKLKRREEAYGTGGTGEVEKKAGHKEEEQTEKEGK